MEKRNKLFCSILLYSILFYSILFYVYLTRGEGDTSYILVQDTCTRECRRKIDNQLEKKGKRPETWRGGGGEGGGGTLWIKTG